MGFVHNTKSEILGIETRSESAILSDISENGDQLFFHYVTRKSDVRNEMAQSIMNQAGIFYGKGEIEKAKQYSAIAHLVKQIALSPEDKPTSFEATYEWLQELVKFVTENEILPK